MSCWLTGCGCRGWCCSRRAAASPPRLRPTARPHLAPTLTLTSPTPTLPPPGPQALAVTTLGCNRSAQRIDSMSAEDEEQRFYLQYSFPPSSVGETGRVGPPGRREVGHGNLAGEGERGGADGRLGRLAGLQENTGMPRAGGLPLLPICLPTPPPVHPAWLPALLPTSLPAHLPARPPSQLPAHPRPVPAQSARCCRWFPTRPPSPTPYEWRAPSPSPMAPAAWPRCAAAACP